MGKHTEKYCMVITMKPLFQKSTRERERLRATALFKAPQSAAPQSHGARHISNQFTTQMATTGSTGHATVARDFGIGIKQDCVVSHMESLHVAEESYLDHSQVFLDAGYTYSVFILSYIVWFHKLLPF